MIYLAAPFFNPSQVETVEKIEYLLDSLSRDYYSPRKDGVLIAMTPEERKQKAYATFMKNVEKILEAELMVAVVDDRDPGVMWEIGFAYATRLMRGLDTSGKSWMPKIVTYTDRDYGLNVMVQECVDSHCKGIDRLRECLATEDFHSYRDFEAEKVT